MEPAEQGGEEMDPLEISSENSGELPQLDGQADEVKSSEISLFFFPLQFNHTGDGSFIQYPARLISMYIPCARKKNVPKFRA